MANLYAPNGLSPVRNRIAAANDFAAVQFYIKSGYTQNIGLGDIVKTGTGANQGYVIAATIADTGILGIFGGVLPYYDQSLQQISHGLNGSYQSTANPAADIPCLVYQDPFMTFMAQISGGPYTNQSFRGQNITWVSGTNGAPNAAGRSTLGLDGASLDTTTTLPFRIVSLLGVIGGPQDPTQANPWAEVAINTSEMLNQAGI